MQTETAETKSESLSLSQVWYKPNQPRDIDFPIRLYGNCKARRFNPSHFDEWEWLYWCPEKNKIFCQYCHNVQALKMNLLARCHDDAFASIGFDDWKHATDKYRQHETSASHIECHSKWLHHMRGISVDVQLTTEKGRQQDKNRTVLEKLITTLLYLARQGQSIRGHAENDGNFSQLLHLRAADCPDLSSWLSGAQ